MREAFQSLVLGIKSRGESKHSTLNKGLDLLLCIYAYAITLSSNAIKTIKIASNAIKMFCEMAA
jgi:hypothetical protein